MNAPTLPTALKFSEWNTKRGKWAKFVGGKTDMGSELRTLEKDYTDVPWDDVFKAPDNHISLSDLDTHIMEGGNRFKGPYAVLKDSIVKVKKHALSVQGEWQKNPLVPKEAKEHLKNIIAACDPFTKAVVDNSTQAHKLLLSLRMRIAELNPKQVAAQNTGAPKIVQAAKGNEGAIKNLKFKADAPFTPSPAPKE